MHNSKYGLSAWGKNIYVFHNFCNKVRSLLTGLKNFPFFETCLHQLFLTKPPLGGGSSHILVPNYQMDWDNFNLKTPKWFLIFAKISGIIIWKMWKTSLFIKKRMSKKPTLVTINLILTSFISALQPYKSLFSEINSDSQ